MFKILEALVEDFSMNNQNIFSLKGVHHASISSINIKKN